MAGAGPRVPGSQHFGIAEFLNKVGYRPEGTTEPPEARWYVSFFDGTLEFGVPVELVVPPWTRMLAEKIVEEAKMAVPGKDPVTVCLRCRAVAAGVWPQCVECGAGPGSEEYYATRVEGEARAAGLWFGRLREMREPERPEDGMARVDYTDPYFKEGR